MEKSKQISRRKFLALGTAALLPGCGSTAGSTSDPVIPNGTRFDLPLIETMAGAASTSYSGSDDGGTDSQRNAARGMQLGNEFSYEGIRLSGQCVHAMRSLFSSRYAITIPFIGGDLGAYNLSSRNIAGMTRVTDTSGDPNVHDMVVIDVAARGGVGRHGHVLVVAQTHGSKRIMAVDSNWNNDRQGGAHLMDLNQYRVLSYQRPSVSALLAPPRSIAEAEVTYRGHLAFIGDFETVARGEILGTVGESRRMEAIQIESPGRDTVYQVHVANVGWMESVRNGAVAGTTGRSLQLEAIRIWVDRGTVTYFVHVQNRGWLGPYRNGEAAGTTGQSLRMEAIAIYVSNERA